MYIGCSVNFIARLTEHLVRNTNSAEYINNATTIKCVVIEDQFERELREYMDIKNLKPKYNKRLPYKSVIMRNAPENFIWEESK
ncbi:hypothetical protein M1D49_07825 [Bacillus sp. PK3-056]|uniref:hypothetical protein n=1 Tax=Niallia circulans TaxID=1397 RepID=UPI000F44D174|nr:hypothetical protein [Niallia circulans]AYV74265.1 hypothetical protein C2H98_23400 [Niallia circulans]